MPSFSYRVKDRSGRASSGTLEATTLSEAAARLKQEEWFIVQLHPEGGGTVGKLAKTIAAGRLQSADPKVALHGRVSLKDKLFFTRQFAVMLNAGLSMLMCLNNLYAQTDNKYLRFILREVRKEVEGGASLSVALHKYPKVFELMFIHMLEAGEASGKLDICLDRLHQYYEREYNLRKKVIGALVYPAIISMVAVGAVAVLILFVLPTFAEIFAESGLPLPGVTQGLFTVSAVGRRFWVLFLLMPPAGVAVYRMLRQNPTGRERLDRFWMGVPLIGDLLRKLATARFARTFATLLESGVNLLQGLELVERAVGNAVVAKGLRAAGLSVNKGAGLARPLQESGVFPVMVAQMVAVGEDTGDLSKMLETIAEYYDKEVEYALESLTAMIEPLIIVVLGGVVGLIVAAIFLPMFDLSSGATLR